MFKDWIKNNITNLIIIAIICIVCILGYNYFNGAIQSVNNNYKLLLANQQRFEQVTDSIAGTVDLLSENLSNIGKSITNINGTIGNFKQSIGTSTTGSAEAQRLIEQQRTQLEKLKGILESISNGSNKN